jgi:hypothetical protein
MAWNWGVAFWSHKREGAATILKYRVEEDSETAGKFDIVARMS